MGQTLRFIVAQTAAGNDICYRRKRRTRPFFFDAPACLFAQAADVPQAKTEGEGRGCQVVGC
jgi:hypothetical protein